MAVLGTKGPGNGLPNIHFFSTTAWTPASTTTAYTYVIGGGGSGAAVGNNANFCALGGGAGGCAVSLLTFTAGVTYTATIGAGGGSAGGSASGAGTGLAGVNTTLTGSDIATMTGTGGSGGTADNTSSANGGAGGTPTGGNIANHVGGAGKANTRGGGSAKGATGGGAVGLWMTGRTQETNEQAVGSNDIPRGADIGGFSRGSSNQANTDPFWVAGYQMPVAMEPFSGMVTSYLQEEYGDYSDSNNYSLPFNTMHTGMQSMFSSSTIPLKHTSGEGNVPSAAPFCGGSGIQYNLSYVTSGRGCLGGGGGGAFSSSTAAYSGNGGSGCVLVFPVSM
jgi:hypothetical protein